MIKENFKAPSFNLLSTNGKIIKLKDLYGKFVVIYFYPKNDTPGCTLETNDFNKLLSNFKKLKCEIFGVSKDNIDYKQVKLSRNEFISLAKNGYKMIKYLDGKIAPNIVFYKAEYIEDLL